MLVSPTLALWGVVLFGLSPLLIPLFGGKVDWRSLIITSVVALFAVSPALGGIGDPTIVWPFLFWQTAMFAAFIFVSRMRQRKSAFFLAVASIPSNGVWFATMFVFVGVYKSAEGILDSFAMTPEFHVLLLCVIAGGVVGRLAGAQWTVLIEDRYGISTDHVHSPILRRLDGWTPPTLAVAFFVVVALTIAMHATSTRDILTVSVVGFLQGGLGSVSSRFANKNHPGWILVTGTLAGIVFTVHFIYLLGYTAGGTAMPWILLAPYTIATIVGTNYGVLLSIGIVNLFPSKRLKADEHVTERGAYEHVSWPKTLCKWTAIVGLAYIVLHEQLAGAFGIALSPISFPFTLPVPEMWVRPLSLLIVCAAFFANSVTYMFWSRSGNRSHAPYHAVTCVLHGLVTFALASFTILNPSYRDLLPLAVIAGSIGQLVAYRYSINAERWLKAMMNVPQEEQKLKAA